MAEPATTPLAAALDSVGDRWTLLLVEALLDGPRRFGDLQEQLPRIAPNVLTQRLRRLESEGLVVAQPYSRAPAALRLRADRVGPRAGRRAAPARRLGRAPPRGRRAAAPRRLRHARSRRAGGAPPASARWTTTRPAACTSPDPKPAVRNCSSCRLLPSALRGGSAHTCPRAPADGRLAGGGRGVAAPPARAASPRRSTGAGGSIAAGGRRPVFLLLIVLIASAGGDDAEPTSTPGRPRRGRTTTPNDARPRAHRHRARPRPDDHQPRP